MRPAPCAQVPSRRSSAAHAALIAARERSARAFKAAWTLLQPWKCWNSASSARSRCSTGNRPVPLGGRNQRALLTLLLLRANEPVSTERLVDQLWGEHPPRTATTSLQNSVSQLRKLLGAGFLQTRPNGYVLELDRSQLDLARFEDVLREARSEEPERQAAAAPRGARALARPAARRLGARGLRAGRDPSARGSEAGRARRPDRGRPRARGRRRSSRQSWSCWSAGIRCGRGSARS